MALLHERPKWDSLIYIRVSPTFTNGGPPLSPRKYFFDPTSKKWEVKLALEGQEGQKKKQTI